MKKGKRHDTMLQKYSGVQLFNNQRSENILWFTPCKVHEGQGVRDTSGVQADVCSGEVTAAGILTA